MEGHRNDPPYYDPAMNGISNKMGASGIYLYEVTSLILRILMQHAPLSVLYTHITTLTLNINCHEDYRYTQRCGGGVLDISTLQGQTVKLCDIKLPPQANCCVNCYGCSYAVSFSVVN